MFLSFKVLAYHTDIHTRAAFLEVLTKILQQQGPARFDMLKDSTLSDRFDHLVELVTMMGDGGELPIANALANVVHSMHMVGSISRKYYAKALGFFKLENGCRILFQVVIFPVIQAFPIKAVISLLTLFYRMNLPEYL